jgi:hypothetical protein
MALWRFLCRLLRTLWRVVLVIIGKRPSHKGCVYIPERIINRPDPCIYSQFLLMQLQQPVTWDNPDVALFLGGVEQYTYDLTVSTTYEVAITVHNSSRDKPATGTQVQVRWIEFGAGSLTRHPIATLTADVPVWPGTVKVKTPWTTPSAPGHYCIEVELFHPQDGNPANNRGWNNTQVKVAHSQTRSTIRIFNRWPDGPPPPPRARLRKDQQRIAAAATRPPPDRWRHVHLTVDSYRFNDAIGKEADPEQMFAPRAAAWPARVEPAEFDFGPREAYRDVELIVDAPNGPGEPEVFNVNAWQGDGPAGGVTVTVRRGV